MKIYCFWECKKIGVPFIAESAEVVEICPFHPNELPETDEDTNVQYPNHFEDGHVKRIFSERFLSRR